MEREKKFSTLVSSRRFEVSARFLMTSHNKSQECFKVAAVCIKILRGNFALLAKKCFYWRKTKKISLAIRYDYFTCFYCSTITVLYWYCNTRTLTSKIFLLFYYFSM